MRFACDIIIESEKDRFQTWSLSIQAPGMAKAAEFAEARTKTEFREARIVEMNIQIIVAEVEPVDGICYATVPKEIIQHKSLVDRLRCKLYGK
jgi:hypothetical protein